MKLKYLPLLLALFFARSAKAQDTQHEIDLGYDSGGYIGLELKEKMSPGFSLGPAVGYNPRNANTFTFKSSNTDYSATESGEGYYYGWVFRYAINPNFGVNAGFMNEKYNYTIDEIYTKDNMTVTSGKDIDWNNNRIFAGFDWNMKKMGLENVVVGLNVIYNTGEPLSKEYNLINLSDKNTERSQSIDMSVRVGYRF